MTKKSAAAEQGSIDSVKLKINHFFSKIYLKFKGEEYRKKIASVENSIQQLLELHAESEETREHLKRIEDFVEELIRKEKSSTLREIGFAFYRLIELITKIL